MDSLCESEEPPSSQATAFTQATKTAVGRGHPNSHKLSDDRPLQAGMTVGNAVMKRGVHGIPEWQRPCYHYLNVRGEVDMGSETRVGVRVLGLQGFGTMANRPEF